MEQTMICEENAAQFLFSFLQKQNSKKFLLVCDSVFPFLKLSEEFEKCPVPFTTFLQFAPGTRSEDIRMGAKAFRDRGCDAIVAVGGESAMEAARRIRWSCAGQSRKKQPKPEPADTPIPLVTVPTSGADFIG